MAAGDEPSITRWSFEVIHWPPPMLFIPISCFSGSPRAEISLPPIPLCPRPRTSSATTMRASASAASPRATETRRRRRRRRSDQAPPVPTAALTSQSTSSTTVWIEMLSSVMGQEAGPPQKPLLPSFESAETRNLAETLLRDIIRGSPDVKWESIKGLETAKRLLKEAVVMPIKYPKYFTGLLSPWKGILLFGPPGTGKTMLAKAVATECKTTFFNISASSIVSKWRGDSEKLVKVLFELARHHAPSTIFLDEIDAIISQRGEARSEHEASRRLKTELLIQMDGLTKTNELVFVLAATNLPWELDAAMLRRLEKRILVPLPEAEARYSMFKEFLPSTPDAIEVPYDILVEHTEGYSGSDIRLVCKEAAMQPLRRIMAALEGIQEEVPEDDLPEVGPVTAEDIKLALRNTRPSAHLHAHRYEKFNQDYGSHVLS